MLKCHVTNRQSRDTWHIRCKGGIIHRPTHLSLRHGLTILHTVSVTFRPHLASFITLMYFCKFVYKPQQIWMICIRSYSKILFLLLWLAYVFPELYYDRGNHHEFVSLVKDLARPGEMAQSQTFDFEFTHVEKPYESYTGQNVKLRYAFVIF